mmetsp:Transcript_107173/g.255862  ORF Transcript_107173/g.255862 Transcript_107173/m.255862 type:complete len:320 (+) Transcript_107173:41-1000(+)
MPSSSSRTLQMQAPNLRGQGKTRRDTLHHQGRLILRRAPAPRLRHARSPVARGLLAARHHEGYELAPSLASLEFQYLLNPSRKHRARAPQVLWIQSLGKSAQRQASPQSRGRVPRGPDRSCLWGTGASLVEDREGCAGAAIDSWLGCQAPNARGGRQGARAAPGTAESTGCGRSRSQPRPRRTAAPRRSLRRNSPRGRPPDTESAAPGTAPAPSSASSATRAARYTRAAATGAPSYRPAHTDTWALPCPAAAPVDFAQLSLRPPRGHAPQGCQCCCVRVGAPKACRVHAANTAPVYLRPHRLSSCGAGSYPLRELRPPS